MKVLATLLALVAALLTKAETTDICDRTPKVRDAILKATSADDDCAAVDLASVTEELILHSFGLTSLKAGDFDGLSSLAFLSLNNNQLTTLPEGLFDGLDSLEGLFIEGSQLIALPEDLFDGLSNLEILSLNGNQFTTLPEGLFDGLSSLESLSLDYNRLTTLPAGVFDGLGNLARLYLEGNHLVRLNRNDPLFKKVTASIFLENQTEYQTLSDVPITKVDGGSMVTYSVELTYSVEHSRSTQSKGDAFINKNSTMRRKWVAIHDSKLPVGFLGTPGVTTIHTGELWYWADFSFLVKEPIVAIEFIFICFDIWGQHTQNLSTTQVQDFGVGEHSFANGWQSDYNEASEHYASIAYIARVRTKSGAIVTANTDKVIDAALEYMDDFTDDLLEAPKHGPRMPF